MYIPEDGELRRGVAPLAEKDVHGKWVALPRDQGAPDECDALPAQTEPYTTHTKEPYTAPTRDLLILIGHLHQDEGAHDELEAFRTFHLEDRRVEQAAHLVMWYWVGEAVTVDTVFRGAKVAFQSRPGGFRV
jgi:hypothetical protein